MKQSPQHLEQLLGVLVHVQSHLDEDLSLDAVSTMAGFSSYHFHRVFRDMIGETLKQYTQRLRLERAACQLLLRDSTILDIALDSGFGNHETFSRAFKRQFGVAPRVYRQDRTTQEEARDENREYLNPKSAEYQISKPSIQVLKPVHLAFIRHLGPYEEMESELFDRLIEWAQGKGLYRSRSLLGGIFHDAPSVTEPARLRSDACIEVPGRFASDGEIGYQQLPSGLFAVTGYVGPLHQTLVEAYGEIVQQILALKHHAMVGLPVVEIYRTTRVTVDYALAQTDICIPVRKQ